MINDEIINNKYKKIVLVCLIFIGMIMLSGCNKKDDEAIKGYSKPKINNVDINSVKDGDDITKTNGKELPEGYHVVNNNYTEIGKKNICQSDSKIQTLSDKNPYFLENGVNKVKVIKQVNSKCQTVSEITGVNRFINVLAFSPTMLFATVEIKTGVEGIYQITNGKARLITTNKGRITGMSIYKTNMFYIFNSTKKDGQSTTKLVNYDFKTKARAFVELDDPNTLLGESIFVSEDNLNLISKERIEREKGSIEASIIKTYPITTELLTNNKLVKADKKTLLEADGAARISSIINYGKHLVIEGDVSAICDLKMEECTTFKDDATFINGDATYGFVLKEKDNKTDLYLYNTVNQTKSKMLKDSNYQSYFITSNKLYIEAFNYTNNRISGYKSLEYTLKGY